MEKENIYSKVAKIIQKPYFKDLSEMGFHDKKSHDQILSIVFNKPVYITDNWNEVLDKKDNNPLYYETPGGYWELYRWDNDHLTYKEYPNGDYLRKVYDNYGNLIEHEELDMGNLSIYRYDQNENQIYYENNGFWIVSEFNSNNELIYREKSDGDIYDIRSKNNINESITNKNKLIERVFGILEPPLVQNLFSLGFDYKQTSEILSVLFKTEVEITDDSVHNTFSNTVTEPTVYYLFDMGGDDNEIYYENSDGEWDIHHDYKHFLSQLGKNNINESTEDKNSYYKKIIPLLKKPYMVDFINFNIPRNDWKDIFRMIYGWRSTIHMTQSFEILNGGVPLPQYVQVMLEIPHTGKELLVYYEDEDGDWVEKEYDTKTGKLIGFEDGDGKSYVTESVDRKEKFYNYIVKTMLEDTEYEILDKNYGGTMSEKIASVKFPMYPWEEYTYKPWDVDRWKSGWMMGSMDIDYVVNNFGVDEELAEIIFKKYIKELSLEISEKMPF